MVELKWKLLNSRSTQIAGNWTSLEIKKFRAAFKLLRFSKKYPCKSACQFQLLDDDFNPAAIKTMVKLLNPSYKPMVAKDFPGYSWKNIVRGTQGCQWPQGLFLFVPNVFPSTLNHHGILRTKKIFKWLDVKVLFHVEFDSATEGPNILVSILSKLLYLENLDPWITCRSCDLFRKKTTTCDSFKRIVILWRNRQTRQLTIN